MFVILGAAGNTGRVVADTLLAQRKSVRAVVTDSARGQSLKDKGAEVVVADVEDRNALERVFSGAEGAYVLLPPNHSSNQIRADNDRRAKNIAAATAAAMFFARRSRSEEQRLNSSHDQISYAVFCLKKKNVS